MTLNLVRMHAGQDSTNVAIDLIWRVLYVYVINLLKTFDIVKLLSVLWESPKKIITFSKTLTSCE